MERTIQPNRLVKLIGYALIAQLEEIQGKVILGLKKLEHRGVRVTRFPGDFADGRVRRPVADKESEGRFEDFSFGGRVAFLNKKGGLSRSSTDPCGRGHPPQYSQKRLAD